jgi:hypothetical protein
MDDMGEMVHRRPEIVYVFQRETERNARALPLVPGRNQCQLCADANAILRRHSH